jgi:hypothetical protein
MLSVVLMVNFTLFTVCLSPVYAAMVSTDQVLNTSQTNPDRARLIAFLEREDVQKQLELWGLDKEMAKARVNSLTDEEVSQAARQMDQLPAGGDGLGIIVGAAVLIFLVLLVTDILGLTDVFKFVKKY